MGQFVIENDRAVLLVKVQQARLQFDGPDRRNGALASTAFLILYGDNHMCPSSSE